MIRPILFNTEMVKAILDGRKTVTRRPVKPRPPAHCFLGSEDEGHTFDFLCGENRDGVFVDWVVSVVAPFVPGDVLWVRETWTPYCMNKENPMKYIYIHGDYCYKATSLDDCRDCDHLSICKWRRSIHMPKEAARIFLRVTDVSVERIQEIDNESARAEGCDGRYSGPHDGATSDWIQNYDFSVERFQTLWDSTIKPENLPAYGWNANPWVWVIEFEKCDRPEGFL